jgi:hypothetical protein
LYLDLNYTPKLLDSVEEQITLLDHILVLRILAIRTIGLDDSTDLVNDRVYSSSRDILAQITTQLNDSFTYLSMNSSDTPKLLAIDAMVKLE